MVVSPCKHCGYTKNEDVKKPLTNQRYAQIVCERCGARGPMCKNEMEAIKGWNAKGNYVLVAPEPSKCMDCGWNGPNTKIKDLKRNGQTTHWTCPQCNAGRVTLGIPENKKWG